MKKLIPLAMLAFLAFPLVADEDVQTEETAAAEATEERSLVTWPAVFAVSQWPRSTDVVGLRLTIPFSTSQEGVAGLDLGFWGESLYFEGVQLNVVRNAVVDDAAGIQVGLYNTVGNGGMLGVQIGLKNDAITYTGAQVGIINTTGDGNGFQIGVVNVAETLHGYQIGAINVIRDAEVKFMPFVNIGF